MIGRAAYRGALRHGFSEVGAVLEHEPVVQRVALSKRWRAKINTDEFLRPLDVNKTVRNRRVAARGATNDLHPRFDFELCWVGFHEFEFAAVEEDQEVASTTNHGAGTALRLFPCDFAGRKFDATERRPAAFPGVSVEPVDVVVMNDRIRVVS